MIGSEKRIGRILPRADTTTLAKIMIGTGQLEFAGVPGAAPDDIAIDELVSSIMVGAEPGLGS